jgi:DNA-binding NarL/FixJ family response regulator
MTTVVLVDPLPIVRHGLRSLVDARADLAVVGEAADGVNAVESVARLRPTVAVVDAGVSGPNGTDVLRRLREISPPTRILVLSMSANAARGRDVIRNGATSCVLKASEPDELIHAILETAAGRQYLSPSLRALKPDEAGAGEAAAREPYDTLTPRERQVLKLSAEGHNNTRIGLRLGISSRTVESHRASLMRKLALRSQTGLIRLALRRGIVPPD